MREEPQFELSEHANNMLLEREISRTWVARVLAAPEATAPDRRDPVLLHAFARIPEFGGRVLCVVYNEHCTPWRVVTVYFDRRQRNRL